MAHNILHLITDGCPLHPGYRAKKSPRKDCPYCPTIYANKRLVPLASQMAVDLERMNAREHQQALDAMRAESDTAPKPGDPVPE